MSLMASQMDSPLKCPVVLRTADQYPSWKQRVTTACWAATHRNVFTITDDECKTALKEHEESKGKSKSGEDWVAKCWLIITLSLHEELFSKVSHVTPGYIQTLLTEINAA
jgi:hypothetical protein